MSDSSLVRLSAMGRSHIRALAAVIAIGFVGWSVSTVGRPEAVYLPVLVFLAATAGISAIAAP